jgi:glycine dehydrogenase subunit 1
MRYLPHTPEEINAMLGVIGAESLDDLFAAIPAECRRQAGPDLPEALTEWDISERMGSLAAGMATAPGYKVYLGAGSYEHFIPAAVSFLLGRSEFATAYTPYQPEMTQGTLQAIYEYQSLVTRLLGMEVANASLYEGATALAEALLMAVRITGRTRLAVSSLIHPNYRKVVRTYLKPTGCELLELPYLPDGRTDLRKLDDIAAPAAVAIQSPNFFGCIEKLSTAAGICRAKGGLAVAAFSEPLAYGILKSPGGQGADIACGEGQSLGIPQSYGGPGLGLFAGKKKHVRNMPGRLVGKTVDKDGQRGFVLTLATREQHIRREKATSNICTNNSLCALATAIYLASLGGSGMRELAKLNYDKTEYLKAELRKAGFKIPFESPTFNEFVVRVPAGFESFHPRLVEKKIVAGLPLVDYYPELSGHYLLCVTETKSREDLDKLVSEMQACKKA